MTSERPFVASLGDPLATRHGRTGGKGANLARLVAADFPVPPGVCVTTAAFERLVDEATESEISTLDDLDPTATVDVAERSEAVRTTIRERGLPSAVREAISGAVEALGAETFAVRSSATAEDLPEASFAGQHETFLGVADTDVPDRVLDCMASLFTDRAVSYRLRNGVPNDDVAMAVVVQAMIEPDVAGVLFTADPVTGNRRVASVDANYGLGDTVVAGDVSPDNARVDRTTGELIAYEVGEKRRTRRTKGRGESGTETVDVPAERRTDRALTNAELTTLVDLGGRVEACLGGPQDVEWALVDGSFVVLQSRPITSLFPLPTPTPDDGALHAYLSFGHVQAMPEAMPPLVLDFWRGFFDRGVAAFVDGEDAGALGAAAGGRVYVDVTPVLRVRWLRDRFTDRISVANEPVADGLRELLRRRPEAFSEERPTAEARSVARVVRFATGEFRSVVGGLARTVVSDFVDGPPDPDEELAWVTAWGNALADELDEPTTLADRTRAVFDRLDVSRVLTEPVPRIGGHLLAAVLAGRLLRRWFPDAHAEVDALGRGFEAEVVTRMNQQLGDLADRARGSPAVLTALQRGDDLDTIATVDGGEAFVEDVEAFLQTFGHRASGEIDVSRPRWRDDPGTVLGTVRSTLEHDTAGTHVDHLSRLDREAVAAAADLDHRAARGVLGPLQRRLVDRLVRTYRGGIQLREYPKHGIAFYFAAAHDVVETAGRRLVAEGHLDHVEDVWFLREAELLAALERDGPTTVNVERRRREHDRVAVMTAPPVVTSEGETPTGAVADPDRADVLTGTPVSAGVVEGYARVVRDPTTETLAHGEILVAPSTDPGWTPLFLNAAGLVMEVGGRMTHGALVAREYGLPAVAAVEGATTFFETGDRLRIDGSQGTVERLDVE
ncbi:PEP/pyruvate-binding domain-containing protein [Halomarina rubra]|uniref:PEP/pyruvate-binding domain-containing protein n=1 Tax=Halomarina rubra TaxID=2071873 RepID=A0ABD6AWQ5_9EURY|nr:PEP/pyruvate-binding domain-containing protein [Halomarina rubra]